MISSLKKQAGDPVFHRRQEEDFVQITRLRDLGILSSRYKFCLVVYAILSILLPLQPAFAEQPTISPLTSLEEIRTLDFEKISSPLPVDVEVQITHFHPNINGAFVTDGEKGIFAQFSVKAGTIEHLTPGARFRLQGTTHSGNFIPRIVISDYAYLGWIFPPLESIPSSLRKAGRESGVGATTIFSR
ncbi:hypothetical protein ACFSSA_12815 [Luteolibacter algae]|uniref:Uncharacterized protein n=1 Tax=Luteolibacter algae TaxID=454151 RepID=A0ABW5D914_9BACT